MYCCAAAVEEEEEEDMPLIARSSGQRMAGRGRPRQRSGSHPEALSPKMRGELMGAQKGGRKKSTMQMLMLMDNVSIADLKSTQDLLRSLHKPRCI